ncbi:hypothetical protein ACFVOK_18845 [Streptomyces sp. NPDC057798]|uniref:hypothetical protein n=1 Tax=Streptomyces sp. NPDC057798 TaxID=3346252 RepID=UPI0036CCAA39
MTSSVFNRTRRSAAAAGSLTVIAVAGGVLVLAVGVGVPQGWWPHTGQAFAADHRPADPNRCALIAGPARDSCERAATTTAFAGQPGGADAAWGLVPAGAGVAALVMWRHRSAAGQRRR